MSGTLTVFRGRSQCQLEGVMEKGEDMIEIDKPSAVPLQSQ